jgi:hypothetical protein
MHTKIQTTPLGALTPIELLPNFLLPLSVEIPAGASSPIILKFKPIDQHDNPISDSKIENIMFYGSFNCKSPSINQNDHYVKNPTKILIKEPSDDRLKKFIQNRKFYINI